MLYLCHVWMLQQLLMLRVQLHEDSLHVHTPEPKR